MTSPGQKHSRIVWLQAERIPEKSRFMDRSVWRVAVRP